MGGSEIMAALRNVAIININPALLWKRYKYVQHISLRGFSAHPPVLASISYDSLKLATS